MTRYDKVMNGAAAWGAYYRANPHRFCKDYLHLELRLFQKIIIAMMNVCTIFSLVACRGIGKSWLSAVFCCVRCILYPDTEICIASGKRAQGINVLQKIIYELKPISAELANEINEKETRMNNTEAQIVFKNRSRIKVVTANDSARSGRANILLLDEARMIKKDVIDLVLKKFLTKRRRPRYTELSEKERKAERDKEKNMVIWLSSAYTTDHWFYTTCLDIFKSMIKGNTKHFICGFPYELSIGEGLLDPTVIEDELVESDFSQPKFDMEYSALWWGTSEDAFFDYTSVAKNRRIAYPMLPLSVSSLLSTPKQIRVPIKQHGELRLLSADIALMASTRHRNDATSIFLNQMVPTKAGRFSNNIMFSDACEGLRTDEQALVIRKYYDEFDCDYIVIDGSGVGLGVVDMLMRDMPDPETGEIYPALSCCNNPEMAARCTVPGAPKVIWVIKASAQFNSDCAFMLREAFQSGRIRLLIPEYDAEEQLSALKGYSDLEERDKLKLQLPYIQTTLLIDELTKLQHEDNGGKVRIYERAGMRKDRYSSLAYNYYVSTQLETKYGRRYNTGSSDNMFIVRPPSTSGKAVRNVSGRKQTGWC